MTWTQTFSGQAWELLEPCAEDVSIDDLAHHLAFQCRFAGAVVYWYCTAEHSVRVMRRVEELFPDAPRELRAAALLHDGHEANLGDWTRPVKQALTVLGAGDALKKLTAIQDVAIAKWAHIDPALFHHPLVKQADDEMLATEKLHLMREEPRPWVEMPLPIAMAPNDPLGWSPQRAERTFRKAWQLVAPR